MIIDFDKPVCDSYGDPIAGGPKDRPWTMGTLSVFCLERFHEQADGSEKAELRGKIARRIVKRESIEATDVAEIRKCVAGTFPALLASPAGEYLSWLVQQPEKKE